MAGVNQKKLEEYRGECEALLGVLCARVGGLQDFEDWTTFMMQARDLFRLADSGRHEAAKGK